MNIKILCVVITLSSALKASKMGKAGEVVPLGGAGADSYADDEDAGKPVPERTTVDNSTRSGRREYNSTRPHFITSSATKHSWVFVTIKTGDLTKLIKDKYQITDENDQETQKEPAMNSAQRYSIIKIIQRIGNLTSDYENT